MDELGRAVSVVASNASCRYPPAHFMLTFEKQTLLPAAEPPPVKGVRILKSLSETAGGV
jgi:hypothetical protein